MFFKSLQKEILIFTLGLAIVIILTTAALGIFSTQIAGRGAEQATSDVLREQAEGLLLQIAKSAASRQDIIFERTRNEAGNLASFAKHIYGNPEFFHNPAYWSYSERVFRQDGKYLNRSADISSIFIPQYTVMDAEERKNLELTAYLDFVVPSILENNKDGVAIYLIDTKGAARYFPNIVLGDVVPKEHSTLDDIVYAGATLKDNPERKVVWSPLYDDPAKRGLMITASAPIYTGEEFKGVVGIDILLNKIIEAINSYSPIEGSYAFLVDREGTAIAFSRQAYEDLLGRPQGKDEVRTKLLEEADHQFSAVVEKMIGGSEGFARIERDRKNLFLAFAPLEQTGFSMGIVAPEETMLRAVGALHVEISSSIRDTIAFRIFPVSLVILLLACVIGIFFVGQIVRPIRDLSEGVREIGGGNLDYVLEVKSKNEIGGLARSFNQMSRALKESRQNLEEKVEIRTRELAEANERLREMDRMKSDFVSIASHQLRAPLTAIKGYSSMLVEGSYGKLQEKAYEAAGRILKSADNLVAIVEDFLNLTRIEQGKLSYEFVPLDIASLAREIYEGFRSHAEEKGLDIGFSIAREKGPLLVRADAGKLRQVISNLVDNALKYTPKGRVDIRFSHDKKNRTALLCISDTGIGIAPGDMPRLFERFSRGSHDGGRRLYTEGTGLGLYVARQMIEAHRGRIWAESDGSGRGSKFCIELPEISGGAEKSEKA